MKRKLGFGMSKSGVKIFFFRGLLKRVLEQRIHNLFVSCKK